MKSADDLIFWGDVIDEEIVKPENDTFAADAALRYVVWNKTASRLGAGSEDDVDAIETDSTIVILSKNRRLRYIGLEVFKKTETGPKKSGDIFMQTSDAIDQLMGVKAERDDMDDDGFDKFNELELGAQIDKLLECI